MIHVSVNEEVDKGRTHVLHVHEVADALGDEVGGGGVQPGADLILIRTEP